MSEDGIKSKRKRDPTAKAAIKILKAIEKHERLVNELLALQESLHKKIQNIKDPLYRLVLYERFILLKKWSTIADSMNYSKGHLLKIYQEAAKLINN